LNKGPIQPAFTVEELNSTTVEVKWEEFAGESVRSGEVTRYKIEWKTGRPNHPAATSSSSSDPIEVSSSVRSRVITGNK
jgi:hypothetical protein